MKTFLAILAAILSITNSCIATDGVFDVRDFGAKGDNRTLDTTSIQRALDACKKAGGGTVIIPPGDYRSGALALPSQTVLCIQKGAKLLASTNEQDYASGKIAGKWGLLVAENANHLTLSGDGIIDGQGIGDLAAGASEKPAFRVRTLIFNNCKNITISNITILNSDAWTLNFKRCEDVCIDHVTIHNNYRRINTDGIDPDMCRNVRISNCHITTGDDCIVLKTTENQLCEGVFVSDCVLESYSSALKLGTESFGDFRNIVFTNCAITHTRNALGLYCYDGGTMENVKFSNISINTGSSPNRNIFPIFMDIDRRDANSVEGHIRNVIFEGIDIASGSGLLVQGAPGNHIENLTLSNINFRVDRADSYANRKSPSGTRRKAKGGSNILYAQLPSYITIANVGNVTVENVNVSVAPAAFQMFERSAFYGDNVNDLHIERLQRVPSAENGHLPVVDLHNCQLKPQH